MGEELELQVNVWWYKRGQGHVDKQQAGWEGKPIHAQALIQRVPSSYSLGTTRRCVTIKQSSPK